MIAKARIFKNGNSRAVRIPRSLGIPEDVCEVTMEQEGDHIVMRFPLRRQPPEVVAQFKRGGLIDFPTLPRRNRDRETLT
jgi:virulence-associated protein VagC